MPGFLCYVCGKIDPAEFFYNLQLTFDGPPHLTQLKKAIEERVMKDGVLPDGSIYAVCDVEVLDFRMNMWVTVESRHQLYSGCHLTAIRDTLSGTTAGLIDAASRSNVTTAQRLGFAMDAKEIFEALDTAGAGVLNLKSVLRVLRHDVNYAVDIFSAMDKRATGAITFQDFMTVYHERSKTVWRELQERIAHGGRARHEVRPNDETSDRGLDEGAAASGWRGSADEEAPSVFGALKLAEVRSSRGQQPAPTSQMAMPSIAIAPPEDGKSPEQKDPTQVEAARKVVDLLQNSVRRRREAKQKEQRLSQAVVSRLKEVSRPVTKPTPSAQGSQGPASPTASLQVKRR